MWLYSFENLDEDRQAQLSELQQQDLKTSRAWAIKENFRWFWDYAYAGNAKKFFAKWYGWARRSRLEPIKKVAFTLKTHLEGLLIPPPSHQCHRRRIQQSSIDQVRRQRISQVRKLPSPDSLLLR